MVDAEDPHAHTRRCPIRRTRPAAWSAVCAFPGTFTKTTSTRLQVDRRGRNPQAGDEDREGTIDIVKLIDRGISLGGFVASTDPHYAEPRVLQAHLRIPLRQGLIGENEELAAVDVADVVGHVQQELQLGGAQAPGGFPCTIGRRGPDKYIYMLLSSEVSILLRIFKSSLKVPHLLLHLFHRRLSPLPNR